jgi:hypothetical protein
VAMGLTAAACKESVNLGEGSRNEFIVCTFEDVDVFTTIISTTACII